MTIGAIRSCMLIVICAAAVPCLGQAGTQPRRPQEGQDPLKAAAEDLQWFREARYGMFVTWDPVSLKGTEISWSRAGQRREPNDPEPPGTVPVEVYDNLYKQFNPTAFNAREWVAIARAAGMRYLVFTTKHHNGFCMFDSKLTDYKITNTPFKRDITAELAEACHEAGLRLGLYYSPPDWHHPDYRTKNHARYVSYLHEQVRELCANYGRVDIMWFDGLNCRPEDWESDKLLAMVRRLQPGVLINDRTGLPGDFDTPEQTIGAFQKDRPWESCITIGDQWAYKPGEHIKSREEILQTLVQCVGGDGNLLFNVGPMPTGEIDPAQVSRLKEIGEWLSRCGGAIYGTRGGPFVRWRWGVSTCRDDKIFLHVFDWTRDFIRLPPSIGKVVSCTALTGGTAEAWATPRGIEIRLPADHRDKAVTVIALGLDHPAESIPLIEPRSITIGKKATASNVARNDRNFGPDKAVDGNRDTRWAADASLKSAWLEVDLGEPMSFSGALICEMYSRVRQFALEVKDGETWRTVARGTEIGPACLLPLAPVTARFVRLNVLEAQAGPEIRELQLYADE
jgi:alpha-L-fucosidase